VPTSDASTVTLRHARVGPLVRPMRCPLDHRSLRSDARRWLTWRVVGSHVALRLRAGRARAQKRLSSYREPSSRDPRPDCPSQPLRKRDTRAPIRLLSTRALRQAKLRASSRLAPRRTTKPFDPAVTETRRCVRPTSATRNERDVNPVPRAFPARSRGFRRREVPQSPRLRATRPGDRTFLDVRFASADRALGGTLSLRSRSIEPLAPLSPLLRFLFAGTRLRAFDRSRTSGWEEGRSRRGQDPRHLEKDDVST